MLPIMLSIATCTYKTICNVTFSILTINETIIYVKWKSKVWMSDQIWDCVHHFREIISLIISCMFMVNFWNMMISYAICSMFIGSMWNKYSSKLRYIISKHYYSTTLGFLTCIDLVTSTAVNPSNTASLAMYLGGGNQCDSTQR